MPGPLQAAFVAGTVTLVLFAITPRISFNEGLGHDGPIYDEMVRALRGEQRYAVPSQFAYRLLPVALISATGLDTIPGYLLIDVLSSLAAAALLYALLTRYGASHRLALLGVLWWAMLSGGIRFLLYYPVLRDGFGFALLLALLLAAVSRRFLVFALLLPVGVLAYEVSFALVPFLWLRELGRGFVRGTLLAGAASLPGLLVFVLVHVAPPLQVHHVVDPLGYLAHYTLVMATNDHGRLVRYLASFPLTLGLFVGVPFLALPNLRRFVRRESGWLYLLVTLLVYALVAGDDRDRFAMLLVPLLATFSFSVAAQAGLWSSPKRAAVATALHAIAVRFAWPLAPDEAGYLSSTAAYMPFERLAWLTAVSLTAIVLGVLVLGGGRRAPATATPDVESASDLARGASG